MSYADEGTAILQRFYTEWAGTTGIAVPNKEFEPTADEPWVRVSILGADAALVSSGNTGDRRYRHTGLVSVQVFVPKNTGDGVARTLAEQACAVFRGVTADDVVYGAPYVTPGGTDGNWYQLNVWAPFRRDSLF